MAPTAADAANDDLVDRLIAQGALWSRSLIAAFRATPRHRFLDRVFLADRSPGGWREVATRDAGPEQLRLVYSDRALITRISPPTPGAASVATSSSSQPSLMAQMLEDLDPAPGQRTLEVGTGTGYNAALLGHVVGPRCVTTVDVDRQVLSEAWAHLESFHDRGIELRHGDGRGGWPASAPFDRLVVTAATPDLEPAWLEQLAPGGVLVAPLALAPGLSYVVRGGVRAGTFHGRLTRTAYFMPLRGERETGRAEEEVAPTGSLDTVEAPWADWFDRRRPRMGWLGFIQALAFFGWLRGLTVAYQTQREDQPAYELTDPADGRVCWLSVSRWRVSGPGGRQLGWDLWRAFLDAGGPWPTEFVLTATPHRDRARSPREGPGVRSGPRCRRLWEVATKRERPAWV
jgi:protein-L-isoaspartate(D-aspartate) O-methyltransferase